MYKEVLDVNTEGSTKELSMGLIKPLYQIIKPGIKADFREQWENCLFQISKIVDDGKFSPFRVNIFVNSKNQADYIKQHDFIHTTFTHQLDKKCPPFGVVMQAPIAPNWVICEVGLVSNTQASVNYGNFNNRPYCIVDTPNYKEYWTIGAQSVHPDLNIMGSSNDAFNYLSELYKHLGITFNNIVRQWNYVGEILSKEDESGRLRQHYQMFNETRSDYYGKYRNRTDFPAATGIGMSYLGVCIDSFSVAGDASLKIVPISNPDQSESYQYGQKVLVGDPDKKKKQNQPPQFERAKLIALNNVSRLMVSGTASIIGQDTIGIDDVEEQTRVTIQNINRLSSEENLRNHYPEIKAIPNKYSYVRVYVKYADDIEKVKAICAKEYGDTPTTYVVADICRDNLLVEIEAELIS